MNAVDGVEFYGRLVNAVSQDRYGNKVPASLTKYDTEVLTSELQTLSLAALHKRATAEGVPSRDVEDALNADNAKGELIKLIVELSAAQGDGDEQRNKEPVKQFIASFPGDFGKQWNKIAEVETLSSSCVYFKGDVSNTRKVDLARFNREADENRQAEMNTRQAYNRQAAETNEERERHNEAEIERQPNPRKRELYTSFVPLYDLDLETFPGLPQEGFPVQQRLNQSYLSTQRDYGTGFLGGDYPYRPSANHFGELELDPATGWPTGNLQEPYQCKLVGQPLAGSNNQTFIYEPLEDNKKWVASFEEAKRQVRFDPCRWDPPLQPRLCMTLP